MKKIAFVLLIIMLFIAGCSGDGTNDSADQNVERADIKLELREIDVKEEDQVVHVTAEVYSTEEEFYYMVEQGEKIIINETALQAEGHQEDWAEIEFEFQLEDEVYLSDEVTHMTFYVKHNGEKINSHYVPIEIKHTS